MVGTTAFIFLHPTEDELSRLTEAQRSCLLDFEIRQMSYLDMAAKYGVALGTIRSRLARAREIINDLRGDKRVSDRPAPVVL